MSDISRTKTIVSCVMAALMLLTFTGCQFGTTVITDADQPDKVVTSFFTSLKQKKYDECDKLFSEKFTIRVTNTSGGKFTDKLVEKYIENLDFSLTDEPEINGINAKQKVQVTTFDKSAFHTWLKENKTRIERKYLSEKQIAEVNHQNTEEVSDLLIYALDEYTDIRLRTTDIELSLLFSNNRWKIVGTQELIEAIYGGTADEQN